MQKGQNESKPGLFDTRGFKLFYILVLSFSPVVLIQMELEHFYPEDSAGMAGGLLVMGAFVLSPVIVVVSTIVGISAHKRIKKTKEVSGNLAFVYCLFGALISNLWFLYLVRS